MAWVENFQQLFKDTGTSERILISGELNLKGDLFLTAPGSIASNLEGNLNSAHHLTIEENVQITGSCRAGNLHIDGRVEGDLHSSEHIRLCPSSYTRGHLVAKTIEITPQADFKGSLEIGSSQLG